MWRLPFPSSLVGVRWARGRAARGGGGRGAWPAAPWCARHVAHTARAARVECASAEVPAAPNFAVCVRARRRTLAPGAQSGVVAVVAADCSGAPVQLHCHHAASFVYFFFFAFAFCECHLAVYSFFSFLFFLSFFLFPSLIPLVLFYPLFHASSMSRAVDPVSYVFPAFVPSRRSCHAVVNHAASRTAG